MPSIKKIIKEEIQGLIKEIQSPLDPNTQMSNISQGYDGGVLNETGSLPTIQITPVEPDPRGRSNQPLTYKVAYEKEVNGELIEIEGVLKPYHTGRNVEYGFEPGYFTDDISSNYWDTNWEAVEDEIRSKFYDSGLR